MTAVNPDVFVHKKETPKILRPGMAGKVAIVGAFDTTTTDVLAFDDWDEAKEELGTDSTYNGCAILDYIFYGASDIIAVNVTTQSGQTRDKTITTAKLTSALAKIKKERFDTLFVAESLTDEFIPIIETFVEERMLHKLPIGYVGAVNRASASAYETTAALFGDGVYGILTQATDVSDNTTDLLKSAAYYCGVISSLNVSKSMTKKQIPNVTGITPEYTFETGDLGLKLLQLGYTTIQCFDRSNDIYVVGNSQQFNGYDLYINRVRDYVIREMSLHQFLGEWNDNEMKPTLSEIEQELARIKNECVTKLQLLKDIEYNVVKKDANCVDVNITKLVFAGIITRMDVYYSIEVQ